MKTFENKKLILLALGIFTPLTLTTPKVIASSFGAEIFCAMRDAGNDHESSWDAAYTYIKKQKGGLFKVSPKNAAAQITETVIREREKFSYCIQYLDNLHPNRKLIRDLEKIIIFWKLKLITISIKCFISKFLRNFVISFF
jgi:hypothetical protein